MKIKKEIEKIIFSETPCTSPKQEKIRKVKELVNLFKSYARSLVPKSIKVKKLSEEDVYDYAHRVFQEMHEEILRRIEGE